jgi:hypothetical protein
VIEIGYKLSSEEHGSLERNGSRMKFSFGMTALMAAALLSSDVGRVVAGEAVQIKAIHFDPPGDESRNDRRLNQERVVIKNFGRRTRYLDGWKLRDRTGNVFVFPDDVEVFAGDRVIVHTGRGRNEPARCTANGAARCVTHLYWGRGRPVWNNGRDAATLKSRRGSVVNRCRYTTSDESPKRCRPER